MIKIDNLNKKYEDKIIFENLKLNIEKGSFVCITGDSGSGKSTLLNIIGLLDNQYDGQIFIDQEKVKKNTAYNIKKYMRYKISYLFQNYALVENKTVFYNLNIAMSYLKITKKQKKNKMNEALQKVGLEGYLYKKIYKLSGGEQQRVALARLILKPSELILADEPTGSLDKKNAQIVLDILKEINNCGKTIIIVTHEQGIKNQLTNIIDLNKI